MGLYQPTVITPSSLNGTGVIDATQDMTVIFQINGTIPIVGWQFVIMQNTVESTVLYTSEWRHHYLPGTQYIVYTFGRDENGNPVPVTDSITAADLAAAGITNGYANGYKLKVNQQYYKSGIIGYAVLEQISPVFFAAAQSVYIDTSQWLSQYGRFAYFGKRMVYSDDTAVPVNTEDPLLYNRWRLAEGADPDNHILEDSGDIYLANNELKVYGLLKNGSNYAVRLNGMLESGIKIDTGWYYFSTAWTDTAKSYIHLRVYYVRNTPALFARLEVDEGHDEREISQLPDYWRWIITRTRVSDGKEEMAAILPKGQTMFYDFGARNNTEYIYKAYCGLGAANGYCYTAERSVKMKYYWDWAVIEAEPETQNAYYLVSHPFPNTMYHVKRVFQFQGNIESGSVSNENKPNVQDNFTPYPTVQKSVRKGLTGTLKAWVGNVTNGNFTDSIKEIDRIMDLSTSESIKFLRDRKGNIRMIEISDAIKKATQDPYAEQPVEIELPWVEVGDAKDAQIVSMLTDGFMTVGDDIYETETEIVADPLDSIEWTWDDTDYVGSEIGMDGEGNLVQTYDDSLEYAPAILEIVDGDLKVTTTIPQEDT